MTFWENTEDVVLLLAVFGMLLTDCNDISRPKTYQKKKKKSLCLSTKRLHAGDIWAQCWGEKSVGYVPVNTVVCPWTLDTSAVSSFVWVCLLLSRILISLSQNTCHFICFQFCVCMFTALKNTT